MFAVQRELNPPSNTPRPAGTPLQRGSSQAGVWIPFPRGASGKRGFGSPLERGGAKRRGVSSRPRKDGPHLLFY